MFRIRGPDRWTIDVGTYIAMYAALGRCINVTLCYSYSIVILSRLLVVQILYTPVQPFGNCLYGFLNPETFAKHLPNQQFGAFAHWL